MSMRALHTARHSTYFFNFYVFSLFLSFLDLKLIQFLQVNKLEAVLFEC